MSVATISCWADGTLDGGFEVVELDGFDEMLREACLQTSFDIAVAAKTADGDSRDAGDRTQLHHQIRATSVRQRNVADQQIELIARGSFHCGAHVMSGRNEMAAADKQFFKSGACVLMIINEQNFQTSLRSSTTCFWRDGGSF